jgi:hypothetical protein
MPTLTKKTTIASKTKKILKKTKKEVILNEEGKDISRYITRGKGSPKDILVLKGLLKDTSIKPFKR